MMSLAFVLAVGFVAGFATHWALPGAQAPSNARYSGPQCPVCGCRNFVEDPLDVVDFCDTVTLYKRTFECGFVKGHSGAREALCRKTPVGPV